MFPELATFFTKGKGRSIMVSSFIVQHNEFDVFILNDGEWFNAVAVYPELLDRLREIVSQHPAFEVTSKLEQLAIEYAALIIWCPKYHCEFNPIEGFWCYLKFYVWRKNY
jgi:hypothetical protein